MKTPASLLTVILALLWAMPASAHKASDSYLRLKVNGSTMQGEWDIALRDLEIVVGLDADHDAKITWGEVKARRQAIEEHAVKKLRLSAGDAPCALTVSDLLIDEHSDGRYAVIRLDAACAQPVRDLTIEDHFLYDMDAQHKNLVSLTDGEFSQSTILSAESRKATLAVQAKGSWRQFFDYVHEGAWHIWIGYDHILFIVSLLLTAAFTVEAGRWAAVEGFRATFMQALKIVTSFTVAHSITLSLAVFGVIELPSRLVESVIALSIAVAALNNLRPTVHKRLWIVTFAFGLIHGLGFAGVLQELGLPGDARVLALLAFNIGVELGQLAIVAALLPLLYLLRNKMLYHLLALRGCSVIILVLALIWCYERATESSVILWNLL